MSTTTWQAPLEVGLQQGQPLAALPASRDRSVRMVSQKMLAVSARAIGVERCSSVRSARVVLW